MGEITVQGSKNTVLPIMAASLLAEGKTILHGCPRIRDVYDMAAVMEEIGCRISWEKDRMILDTSGKIEGYIKDSKVSGFRGSSLLMGALLGRNGIVSIEKPGGCRIGERPLDFHFQGFEKMGACVTVSGDRYICKCKNLRGTRIRLPFPSVGATENLMLAGVRAAGMTVIYGCAREPEICDLAHFLRKMGVKIEGEGTSVIKIWGGSQAESAEYEVPYDRIAAATYLFGGLVTGGHVALNLNEDTYRLENILSVIERIGGEVLQEDKKVEVRMKERVRPFDITTGPHPGIPTDIQSMLMAAALKGAGPSVIVEKIFESRFAVCDEFEKMGGKIMIQENRAFVLPADRLLGCTVVSKDLRGGAALVLAALSAEGETRIESCEYIKRGYEDIVGNFSQLGAQIQEVFG